MIALDLTFLIKNEWPFLKLIVLYEFILIVEKAKVYFHLIGLKLKKHLTNHKSCNE